MKYSRHFSMIQIQTSGSKRTLSEIVYVRRSMTLFMSNKLLISDIKFFTYYSMRQGTMFISHVIIIIRVCVHAISCSLVFIFYFVCSVFVSSVNII